MKSKLVLAGLVATAAFGSSFSSAIAVNCNDSALIEKLGAVDRATDVFAAVGSEEELVDAIGRAVGSCDSPAKIALNKSIVLSHPISFSGKFIELIGAVPGVSIVAGEGVGAGESLVVVGSASDSGTFDKPSASLSLVNIKVDLAQRCRGFFVQRAQLDLRHGSSIENGKDSSAGGAGVYLSNQASMNMYDGSALKNNESTKNGGAVCIWPDGRFYMHGGEISGCSATYGGAIWNSGGSVKISKGSILNNRSKDYGAIGSQANSSCTMESIDNDGGIVTMCGSYMACPAAAPPARSI